MKSKKTKKVLCVGLFIAAVSCGCGKTHVSVNTSDGIKVDTGNVKVDIDEEGVKVNADDVTVDVGDGINVDTGNSTTGSTDTKVKVDTNDAVKGKIPYSQAEELGCLYMWYDEEDKDLYNGYTKLTDRMDNKNYYYKDTNGKILTTTFSFPEVTDPSMSKLMKALEKERKIQKKDFDKTVKEALGYANEMVESIDNLDENNIDVNPYEYDVTWLPIRNDENMLTIVIDQYSFFGGAHPNTNKIVISFNPNTGKKLSIKSIAKNEKVFRKLVEKKLRNYIKKNKCEDFLFGEDMYKEELQKWDQDWWILNGYLFVGFNTYDIAPYVAGPLVIPIDLSDSKEQLNSYGKTLFMW